MKNNFGHIGLAKLCGWFGISRQAYYQNNWEGISSTLEEDMIIPNYALEYEVQHIVLILNVLSLKS